MSEEGGNLDFILPPPDARAIVDKTASFVAKNGAAFEAKIKERQGNDIKFSFLEPHDPYHAYYREKVKRLEAGDSADLALLVAKAREDAEAEAAGDGDEGADESAPAEETAATQAAVITPYLAAKKQIPEGAPAPLQFAVVHPDHLPGAEVDLIKLTAQYTAAGGREFLTALTSKEVENPAYDFLKPTNGSFSYFTALVDAYTKVINPPPDVRSRVAAVAESPFAAFTGIVHRVEWQRAEEERQALADDDANATAAFAAIDWHDFEVVGTITLEGEAVPGAAPTVLAGRAAAASGYTGMGVSSAAPVVAATAVEDDGSDMSDDDEAPAAAGGRGGAPSAAGAHTYEDDDEVINVQSGYVPVIPAPGGKLTHFVDPQTGKEVPIASISEHMRISLLDPKWRTETERALEKQSKSLFVSGDDVAENLRRMAANRADIFGAEAARARAEVGNTTAGATAAAVAWDGDYASADAMAAARAAAAAKGLLGGAAPKPTGTQQGPAAPPASKRARTQ